MSLQTIIGVALGILVAAVFYLIWRMVRVRMLKRSLGKDLLLVKIPKETIQTGPGQPMRDFKTEINKFEELLGSLAGIKEPVVLEMAVPHVGEEIHFYVSIPKRYSEITSKQIQGIWNGASVEKAPDDYSIFNPQGTSVGAYLKLKSHFALPIRSYLEIQADTVNPIFGGFAKVAEVGEGAALQVILKSPGWRPKKNIRRALNGLKQGWSMDQVLGLSWWKLIKGAVHPQYQKRGETEERVVDEDAVKAVTAKLGKPLFKANVRVLASGPSPFQANDVLEGIATAFEQFASPTRNNLKVVKPRNPKGLIYNYIFRQFDNSQSMILTSEEVASLYHFPTPFTETPRIKWLKSKEAPPPPDVPAEGTLIGESDFRGDHRPIRISPSDRKRHVYVIGQTGTGKSTLLSAMAIEDVKQGKGVALIDPHGDLVETILGHIPKERAEDVIVFDPGDLSRPLGMNMLDYNLDRPEERTFIVNEMQSIFNKLFTKETMGPMFEQYMRNALLLMMEDAVNEPATLVELPRVFTDGEYRNRKLARIHNAVVLDFWQKEAIKATGEGSLSNMAPYITSKFGNFITNDYVRPIIGQARSAFNFRQAMDENKIILVNLSKGRIGDINAQLLGMIVTGKVLMAALSRTDIPEEQRKDFCLYIDEFQNFSTDSIATILSEARKYGLALTMAHQFIAQLEEKIRDAVFGNVGTQIVFRVGAKDAEFLVKQFEPVFSQNDLLNIDNYRAFVKLLVRGQTTKPFNMRAFGVPRGNSELAGHFKEYSRLKYGMDRNEIESEIYRRLRE